MAQIEIKFDNTLEKQDIIIPLTNSSPEEVGENYIDNKTDTMQTSVYGILAPIIMINNIVVDFIDVKNFSLKSTGYIPNVYIEVYDRYKLTAMLDTPRFDNQLIIQILPPFDSAYKKINLIFYISNITIKRDLICISGQYKLPELTNSKYKCLGELSTYKLFEQVAIDTKMGFATNCEDNPIDIRYMYCDDKSYLNLLESEINYSYTDEATIYDWWIDWWDNINLANIKERYTTIDSDDNMKIWISSQPNEMTKGVNIVPIETSATITNHPFLTTSELYVASYEILNKPGSRLNSGTDKIFSIYENDYLDYKGHLMQDGDVQTDIFIGSQYVGENFGEYNYLLADSIRQTYIQKLNIESIKVVLKTPLLALMRGQKVNLLWYINDTIVDNKYDVIAEAGAVQSYDDIQTEIPIANFKPDNIMAEGWFKIDKTISGQYLITKSTMGFYNGQWYYELILNRPYDHKPDIINKDS